MKWIRFVVHENATNCILSIVTQRKAGTELFIMNLVKIVPKNGGMMDKMLFVSATRNTP